MKLNRHRTAAVLLSIAGSLSLLEGVQAGPTVFVYTNRDLVVSFRKTGADGVGTVSANDFEVDIGQASIYYSAAPGSTTHITQYTAAQIAGIFDSVNDMNWSVAGCVPATDTSNPSVPVKSLWMTAPRANPAVPAAAWVRNSASTQGTTAADINSILQNAAFYSGTISNNSLTNNGSAIAIPVGSGHEAGAFLGSLGNFLNTFQGDVENTTPPTFTTGGAASRSDLYQLNPDSTGTQPAGAYLGYFELETNGSMVFVAASTAVSVPAPTLTATAANGVETISFPSFSGATYTLYYTNSAGLAAPIHTWPAVSTNIAGDGSTKSFQQTITDPNRFYSVGAH
jgi:hypothetical protein